MAASLSVGPVVNVSHASQSQAQPAIAVNPANPQNLVAFADEVGAKGIMKSVSTDGGKTWTSSVVANGVDNLPTASGEASVVFDVFGNMFLSYLDSTQTKAAVVESPDGGQTLKLVTTLNAVANQPQLAVGPGGALGAGSLWVAYRDVSGNIALTGAPVTGPGQVGSFITPEVATGSNGGDFPRLSVGPKGQVVVVFESPSNNLGPAGIFSATDPDGLGPKTLNATVHVTDVNIGGLSTVPAQPVRTFDSEAAVAYDNSGLAHNGRIYLVKTDAFNPGDQATAIFLQFSDDDGLTWSADTFVDSTTPTATQFLPRIAVDPATGVVGLSWIDTRNDPGSGSGDTDGKPNTDVEMFATISVDGGATFLPSVKVASGPSNAIKAGGGTDDKGFDYGGYTGLSFFNNVMYPAWPDNSTSLTGNPDAPNFDIATAAVTVAGGPTPVTNLKVTAIAPAATEGAAINARVATFVDLGSSKPLSSYTATINWGDGTPSSSGTITADPRGGFDVTGSHTYLEEGSSTLTVSVSVNATAVSSGTAQVSVTDAALSAIPGGNVNTTEGNSLAGVSLARFTDANPSGPIGDYSVTINWGDGTPSSSGSIVADPQGGFDVIGSHTYSEGGSDTLSMTIKDKGGATITAQVLVTVADLPLTAQAVPKLSIVEGTTATLLLGTFTDANPSSQATEYTATIHWGDGTTSSGSVVADPQGGFDITGSHMLDESTSSITINLADAGGSTATINEPVTVTDAALSAGPIALNGFEGVRFSNSVVATFSDANLQAPSTDFTATIDWGNGSSGAGTIVSQGNGMFGVLGSSAYALPGTYPVTVSIQDVGGSKTVVKSSIVVADAPLSVQGRMFQLVEGGVFSGVIATFTDANPLSSAGDFSATIRWSDG
ncbi:MAG TPA: hypothetical protein VGZ22_28600, partial [Isosphaeraceae bacterium]|nr:hypothetical protein [Isosphaeraceae bacterium]